MSAPDNDQQRQYQSGQPGLLPGDGSQTQGGLFTTADGQQQPQYQTQQQTQQPSELPGGFAAPPQQAQTNTQFAPPPANVPSQAQQAHSSEQYFPPPPPPGPPSANVPSEAQQAPSSEQFFPPPPPGPPPAHAHVDASHADPLLANPVKPSDASNTEKLPDPAAQTSTIPTYNPSAPQFAPPPTDAPPVHDSSVPATSAAGTTAAGTTAAATATTPTDEPVQGKHGWGSRFSKLGHIAAGPINSLTHKLGSQSFLPGPLDKECDKAAAILKAFCNKGIYADPVSGPAPTSTDPDATPTSAAIIDPTKEKPKSRVLVSIPPKVIAKAAGLAIFTTLRAGFNLSGATGSGILIARLPDGSWGAPSAISVHSVGAGFAMGMDIYDCVCVINTPQALEAFTKSRMSLGSDVSITAGPIGAGRAVQLADGRDGRKKDDKTTADAAAAAAAAAAAPADQTLKPEEGNKKRRSISSGAFQPVFSYVKSRGFFVGIIIDGTVVVHRDEANAAFYGTQVSVENLIKGQVPAQGPSGMWPVGARLLHDTLKGAEVGSIAVKEGSSPVDPVPPAAGTSTTDYTAAGGSGADLPPSYVDDGTARPNVGDVKYK